MTTQAHDSETLLTPAEVAAMFRVDPKTVTRWGTGGAPRPPPPRAPEPFATPARVASSFPRHPKTVPRWAKAGKLSSIRTLGGHRRYRESEVRALLAGPGMALPGQRRPAH